MQLHCLAWLMSSHLVLLGCLPFWCFAVFRFQVREFDTAEQMHDWIESCHRHHREQWSLERSQAGSQNRVKFQNILGELRNSVYIIRIIYIYILHLMYQDIIHLSKTLQHTCIGFGCSFAAQVEGEGPEKEQLAKFFACADAWHARAVQAGDRSDLRCFWVYY